MTSTDPLLESLHLEDDTVSKGAAAVMTAEAKKRRRGGQCSKIAENRVEIVKEILKHFPCLTIPEAATDERWKAAVAKNGKVSRLLLFSCSICGVSVSRQLVSIRAGRAPICSCHTTKTDPQAPPLIRTDLKKALHPRYIIEALVYRKTTKQRELFVSTTCRCCKKKNESRCCHVKAGHSPACWCSGQASWKGSDGYYHLLKIIQEGHSTHFFELSCTLEWWLSNVSNNNSKVAITCTLCGKTATSSRISAIQQNTGGVGCHCTLHGALVVRKFLESFCGSAWKLEHSVVRSSVTQRPLCVDFALGVVDGTEDLLVLDRALRLLREGDKETAESKTLDAVEEEEADAVEKEADGQETAAVLPSSPTLPIFVEIDGGHHFSLIYDGRFNERYMYRDYEKEVAILQMPAVLIRISHKTVMTTIPQNQSSWKAFMRYALTLALSSSGGCILHEAAACYVDAPESFYAKLRNHEDSSITFSSEVLGTDSLVQIRRLRMNETQPPEDIKI
jgi:hypothetical protein